MKGVPHRQGSSPRQEPLVRPLIGALVVSLLMLSFAGAIRSEVDAPEPLSAFPRMRLDIRHGDRGAVIHIDAWVADRPSRQEQGLMFVHGLAEHQGMLFVFPSVQRITMWMKNTYIPLDMVFIGEDERIQIIAPRTTPLSLDLIAPPQPARAVLELKGGACAALGIHAGDRLVNLHFPPAQ